MAIIPSFVSIAATAVIVAIDGVGPEFCTTTGAGRLGEEGVPIVEVGTISSGVVGEQAMSSKRSSKGALFMFVIGCVLVENEKGQDGLEIMALYCLKPRATGHPAS